MIKTYKYLAVLLAIFTACSPDEFSYPDNNTIKPDDITGVTISPNHYSILADGRSEIDFKGGLYKFKDSVSVLNSRIPEDWISYEMVGKGQVNRFFKTESNWGDTLKFYAKYRNLVSDTVSIRVIKPLLEKIAPLTVPVVFHILNYQENIDLNRTVSDKWLQKLLQKVNGVFLRQLNNSPNGANTQVHFKLANYKPNGQEMPSPGLNRFIIGPNTKITDSFLKGNNLFWPYQKYLNVWIIYNHTSSVKLPSTQIEGSDNAPEGIQLSTISQDDLKNREVDISDVGFIIKLQDVLSKQNSSAEMVSLFGRYMGLLPTYYDYSVNRKRTDYCDDTFHYIIYGNQISFKKSMTGFVFESDNIMDDPIGKHRVITQDQALRIRWYLKYCPDRWMWKSDFAFTGHD